MHFFQERFEANLAAGLSRPEAMRKARAEDESGFRSWLAEFNAKHGPAGQAERLRRESRRATPAT